MWSDWLRYFLEVLPWLIGCGACVAVAWMFGYRHCKSNMMRGYLRQYKDGYGKTLTYQFLSKEEAKTIDAYVCHYLEGKRKNDTTNRN